MKIRFFAAVVLFVLLEVILLVFVWGSQPLRAERAITPTPTITIPALPTEPIRTPIPTLIRATLPAPVYSTNQVVLSPSITPTKP